MARLFWIGVGAAGGIYTYRKGEQALDVVHEQGILGAVQLVAAAMLHSGQALGATTPPRHGGLRLGRYRITRDPEGTTTSAPAAIMDRDVIDITGAAMRGAEPRGRRKVR